MGSTASRMKLSQAAKSAKKKKWQPAHVLNEEELRETSCSEPTVRTVAALMRPVRTDATLGSKLANFL